jgi:hypothetical protein
MEELIQKVTEKAGISPEQAKNAVATVVEFIKTRVPGIGDQVAGLLSGNGGTSDVIGSLRGKLGL